MAESDLFKTDPVEYYRKLTSFFSFYCGHEEFWNIIKVVLDKKTVNPLNEIQHIS